MQGKEKRKKRILNTNKKQRKQTLDAYFGIKEKDVYTLSFNLKTGLELHNSNGQKISPKGITSKQHYDRASKPKIVAYSESSIPPFTNASLSLRNYNYISAIDTNTRKIHGRSISVCMVFLGLWENNGEYTRFDSWPDVYIDFFDFVGKPERFAWHKVSELITKGPDYDGNNTFGIIVDSELGEIPSINARETPLYENYYLPNKMELLYASADKSGTVQNFMIKKCDQSANMRLNRFEEVYNSKEALEIFPKNYINIGR